MSTGSRWISLYAVGLLRWRWAVLTLVAVQVALCSYGIRHLEFEPDGRVYFGPTDPQRVALDALEATYSRANNVVFVLAPADGKVYTPQALQAVAALTEAAWRLPYTTRVQSLVNHPLARAMGDDLEVADLVPDPQHLGPGAIARIRAVVAQEPGLEGVLVAPGGDVTAVQALVTLPGERLDEVPKVAAAARALAAEFRAAHPGIAVYLTGGVLGDMAFAEASRGDMEFLTPAAVGLIVLILVLGLRSWAATAATLVVIVATAASAMGIAGYLGMGLNTSTIGAPIIILTLGVCHCMHVVVALGQQRRAGLRGQQALAAAVSENALAMFITSLTTAVSFSTLNFSSSPPFRDLGNLVSLGELMGYAYAMTLLPILLSFTPAPPKPPEFGLQRALRDWVEVAIRWRRPLLAAGLVGAVLVIAGVRHITYNDDFVRYFGTSFPFRVDTEFMEQRLTGLHAVHFSLDTGREMGVADPAYLRQVDAFAAWLRTQNKVSHVLAFSDVMKRLNRAMHGDDPAYERLPDDPQLAAQYLLLYELSLPPGQELGDQLDVRRGASRVVVRISHGTSNEIRALGDAGSAWLAANAPALATQPTGLSMVYAHLSERNVRRMVWGTFMSLGLVSAILLVVLRSPGLGLLSLVPNILPAAMAYGLWGYWHGEVTLTVSIVGAMMLGIVVDDTVHLISHFRDARRAGHAPVEAVRISFGSVGEAVALSSLALLGGFVVLAASDFGVTHQMGLLCTYTIVLGLIAELVLLPPLLLAYEDLRAWRRT